MKQPFLMLIVAGLLSATAFVLVAKAQDSDRALPEIDPAMTDTVIPQDPKQLTDGQWRAFLSPLEFRVLRQSATEYPGTGRYLDDDAAEGGAYHCVGCGHALYPATNKFHSGCGWPSFFEEVNDGAITRHEDTSHGMTRVEMRCANCDGHLGHIFEDAPDQPGGKRHCVNGAALLLVAEDADLAEAMAAHRARVQAGEVE
jgi:peptide-methionine (R)-S-oxide reductase